MAIYHLSVKAISRSSGRSATAAAAYRAGCDIADERTGYIHDYRRKSGVESTDIVLPDDAPEWATDRSRLWNAAELAEKRKDACVAREFEVALPAEISPKERKRLALDFAKEIANQRGCALDVAIHAPHREGDTRNHHAHILCTTRKIEADGLGEKLDTEKAGRNRKADLETVRVRWAELTNDRLRENGIEARVDHRSLEAQEIDRQPTRHLGPAATGYERRTGEPSRRRLDFEAEVTERLTLAKEAGELARQNHQTDRSLIDLSGDLNAAKAERDRQSAIAPEMKQAAATGIADFRAMFEANKLAKAGKQQAREAFEQQKAGHKCQTQAGQDHQQMQQDRSRELTDRLEKQRQEREAKKRERGGPEWSR